MVEVLNRESENDNSILVMASDVGENTQRRLTGIVSVLNEIPTKAKSPAPVLFDAVINASLLCQ